MILNSRIGRFEFDNTVLLNHAKLVRDTVVGQWLFPKPGNQILRTIENVYEFMRAHSSKVIAAIDFVLVFPEEPEISPLSLEELPQPPLIPVPPIWVRQALIGGDRPAWLEK